VIFCGGSGNVQAAGIRRGWNEQGLLLEDVYSRASKLAEHQEGWNEQGLLLKMFCARPS
jgi:hypothetical protein